MNIFNLKGLIQFLEGERRENKFYCTVKIIL